VVDRGLPRRLPARAARSGVPARTTSTPRRAPSDFL